VQDKHLTAIPRAPAVLGHAQPQTAYVVKRASEAGSPGDPPGDRAHGDVPRESDQLGRPTRQTVWERVTGERSQAGLARGQSRSDPRRVGQAICFFSDQSLQI
jgi:hypothetical protein